MLTQTVKRRQMKRTQKQTKICKDRERLRTDSRMETKSMHSFKRKVECKQEEGGDRQYREMIPESETTTETETETETDETREGDGQRDRDGELSNWLCGN